MCWLSKIFILSQILLEILLSTEVHHLQSINTTLRLAKRNEPQSERKASWFQGNGNTCGRSHGRDEGTLF